MAGSTISNSVTHGIVLGTVTGGGTYASPLTIVSFGGVTLASAGDAVYGPGTAAWTVVNQGSILALGTAGNGIDMRLGGSANNSGLIEGYSGIFIDGGLGTVTNSGTIDGTIGPNHGPGVYLDAGGYVNNSGTIAGANFGVEMRGAVETVVNSGTIESIGNFNFGVGLLGGGSVTNQSGGYIYGGVKISGTTSTIVNYGDIKAAAGANFDVLLLAGGAVTNQGGGYIDGGVQLQHAAGSVLNSGTIIAEGVNPGVYLAMGGYVDNSGTAALIEGATGVRVAGSGGSVVNFGTIKADGIDPGVYLAMGGSVDNAGTDGLIEGATGVRIAGTAGSVVNAGTIDGTSGDAVSFAAGGYLDNETGGTIHGSYFGVEITGAGGTVVNSGTIIGTGGYGVGLFGGGAVTNQAGGDIQAGVLIQGLAGTVANYGSINDPGFVGVRLAAGGSIDNSGTAALIEGSTGVYISGAGSVSNSGAIIGSSGVVFGAGNGGSTLTNAGTISGTAGDAVSFAGSGNLVVVDPGATFVGIVDGGTGSDTLELASAAAIGTVSGLGSNYLDFSTVTVDAGAQWELAGNNTIGAGVTLNDLGSLTSLRAIAVAGTAVIGPAGELTIAAAESLATGTVELAGGSFTDAAGITVGAGATLLGNGTVSGPVGGAGLIEASGGTLDLTGAVLGTATGLEIADAGSGTLELGGAVAAGATIAFAGGAGSLLLIDFSGQTLTGFGGVIAGLSVGTSAMVPTNAIDLRGVTTADITAATLSGDTIVIDEGTATVATLALGSAPGPGSFVDYIADGAGGTDIFLSNVPCFGHGTHIRCAAGEVAGEDLAIGDRVVVRSGALRPVKWIGRRSYDGRFLAGNRAVLPITVRRGALADGVPCRDLVLSPHHALLLDGVLVPVEHLVNGVSVVQSAAVARVDYFHVELDSHDALYAEGALAETFVDCDSRTMFHNAHEFAELYPGEDPPRWQFCAPRLEAGAALAAVQRRIDARCGFAAGPARGFLDEVGTDFVRGWARDPRLPGRRLTLEILVDGAVVAQLVADQYRGDVAAAGEGDGWSGFHSALPLPLSPAQPHEIRVRREGDIAELSGSPQCRQCGAVAAR